MPSENTRHYRFPSINEKATPAGEVISDLLIKIPTGAETIESTLSTSNDRANYIIDKVSSAFGDAAEIFKSLFENIGDMNYSGWRIYFRRKDITHLYYYFDWNGLKERVAQLIESLRSDGSLEISNEAAAELATAIVAAIQNAARPTTIREIPETLEDAVRLNPNFKPWPNAKANKPGITILSHLRDPICGYGMWTASPPGLPRKSFGAIDPIGYRDLYSWLTRHAPEIDGKKGLPSDIHLPISKEIGLQEIVGLTRAEVRQGRRIASIWERNNKPPTGGQGR